jgi:hypothetical protein
MAIVGLLTLIVCVIGLALYLSLTKWSRGSFAEIGRIMFAFGLLAFLISTGAQSCSIGTSTPAARH